MPYGNFATFSESPEYWEMIIEAMFDVQDPAEAARELAGIIKDYINRIAQRAEPRLRGAVDDAGLVTKDEMVEHADQVILDMLDSYWDVVKTELEKIRQL